MGVAQVLPWNMHMSESDLFYVGQFSAIQDCLYRHVRSSRYVLTADADELFVPKSRDNLLPLLDDLFSKVSINHVTITLPGVLLVATYYTLMCMVSFSK